METTEENGESQQTESETMQAKDDASSELQEILDSDEVEGVLEKLEQEAPTAARKIKHLIAVQSVTHRGPMPSPSDLGEYGKVLPNLPDRMMTMAEKSQKDSAAQQSKILELKSREMELSDRFHLRDLIQEYFRLTLAFIIVMVCLIGSFYLAMHGHETVAGVIGGTTVLGIVAAFLRSPQKSVKADQSNEKQDD